MALFDAFLKLDAVKGESADAKHSAEIDVLRFTFTVSNPVSIGSATGGAGAGRAKFDGIRIVKKVDASSPLLLQACASGQHFKEGNFVVRKAGGQQLEYLKVKMSLCFITDYEQHGSPKGDEIPLEEITMAVGSIVMQYQQQGADGKELGGPTMASWNQVKNIADPILP